VTGRRGKLPVNPSGGVLSTNLHAGSGLLRVAEAVLQVTGRAGEHQVEGARTALAHGLSAAAGPAAAANCVVVLGGLAMPKRVAIVGVGLTRLLELAARRLLPRACL